MHRIVEKNTEALTGTCSICGPVQLKYKAHKKLYVCKSKWNADHRARMAKKRGVITDNFSDELTRLTEAQGGVCAICATTENLCVDHDHVDGKIRGLLCKYCNLGIGAFRDSPERLRKGIEYLANFA